MRPQGQSFSGSPAECLANRAIFLLLKHVSPVATWRRTARGRELACTVSWADLPALLHAVRLSGTQTLWGPGQLRHPAAATRLRGTGRNERHSETKVGKTCRSGWTTKWLDVVCVPILSRHVAFTYVCRVLELASLSRLPAYLGPSLGQRRCGPLAGCTGFSLCFCALSAFPVFEVPIEALESKQGQAWNPKTTPQSALTTNVHRPRKLARPNLLEAPS